MISNVNEGVCQWRLTNNQPSFFVNWQQDGKQHYQYFAIRSYAYNLFLRMQERAETMESCQDCGHAEINHANGVGCRCSSCLCTKAFC